MNVIAAEKVETLNVCIGTYPHTQALKKGDVKSERVVLNFTEIDPINKAFRMMAREQKFDVAVSDRVVVCLLGRADLQRQVRDPVAVRGDPHAEPGPGPGRAAEDEPRPSRLEHVHRLVRVPGLRAAVGDPPHAERGRVVVRRLFRVPDREHHGVHADDGKAVLQWRRHVDRMRFGFKLRNQIRFY